MSARDVAALGFAGGSVTPLPKSPKRSREQGTQPAPAAPGRHRNLTDLGNAERLADQQAADLRFCEARGWMVFDARRWRHNEPEAMRRAKATVRGIYAEAAHVEDDDERKRLVAHARASEGLARLEAMLRLARSERPFEIVQGAFDADPLLLNVLNGTIDLRTGELRPHRREDLLTKLVTVAYDPTARCDAWERFLRDTTGGNEELIGFLRRAVGYSLTGLTSEEKLFFVHGPAASGKSSFVEGIKTMMGDYARAADFESFLARRDASGAPRNDLAALAGARFVPSIEVDDGRRLAAGLVKQLTGGDTIAARFLYKETFEFLPSFKLWLVANDAPRVSDADSGMWRRILRVPFVHEVPPDRRDPKLKTLLKDPTRGGAAILAWAVRGCLEWQERGLDPPALVTTATEDYRRSQDPLRDFVDERCRLDPTLWTRTAELRAAYERWCAETGELHPLGRRSLAERLTRLGAAADKTTGGMRIWRGVGLVDTGA